MGIANHLEETWLLTLLIYRATPVFVALHFLRSHAETHGKKIILICEFKVTTVRRHVLRRRRVCISVSCYVVMLKVNCEHCPTRSVIDSLHQHLTHIFLSRETALLIDSKNSCSSSRQWVALVVGHELAHQWFGNLVTMVILLTWMPFMQNQKHAFWTTAIKEDACNLCHPREI